MTRDPLRLVDFLGHILEAIERIERYTADLDATGFQDNVLVQDAVIRNLEIIGEASRNITTHAPEFAAAHPELPLGPAYQMRNAVAHGYFTVDLDVVWKTVRGDLPEFRLKVQAALRAARGAGKVSRGLELLDKATDEGKAD